MPNILIIGATGYLGKRLAGVLVRSGQHRVFGIARSEAKAKSLALEEVVPIICADPANEPSAYLDAVRAQKIHVVVDAAGAGPEAAKFLSHAKTIAGERLDAYKKAGLEGSPVPKLGFVYCSGTWVHGSNSEPANDLDVLGTDSATPPPGLMTWRVGLEKDILASSDVLDVAILRPALMYGYEHAVWTEYMLPLWQAARGGSTDSIKLPLEPASKPVLVHVDDAAIAFKAAIEKLSLINSGSVYPVFDLATSQESMAAILDAAAKTWGFKSKVELVGAGGDLFAEAMSTTSRVSSARARQLLGWEPTRLDGMVADMDIFAAAFASQH